jgi:hypothetical protein
MNKEAFTKIRLDLYAAAMLVGRESEKEDDVVLIETYDHLNDAIDFLEQYGAENGLFKYEGVDDVTR